MRAPVGGGGGGVNVLSGIRDMWAGEQVSCTWICLE